MAATDGLAELATVAGLVKCPPPSLARPLCLSGLNRDALIIDLGRGGVRRPVFPKQKLQLGTKRGERLGWLHGLRSGWVFKFIIISTLRCFIASNLSSHSALLPCSRLGDKHTLVTRQEPKIPRPPGRG